MPALKATTGMPAAMAFLTAGASAGGSGRVTAMPSTLLSIALWIRLAWLPEDGSDEYLRVTLSLAAAALAPFWMMSQNVSPGAPWVTMAMVRCGVLAVAVLSADFLPPLLEHAATRRITAASNAISRYLRSPVMALPLVCRPSPSRRGAGPLAGSSLDRVVTWRPGAPAPARRSGVRCAFPPPVQRLS